MGRKRLKLESKIIIVGSNAYGFRARENSGHLVLERFQE